MTLSISKSTLETTEASAKLSRFAINYKRTAFFLINPTKNNLWSPHRDQFIDHFEKNLFWTTPNFFPQEKVHALLTGAKECEELGLLKPATIGKGILKKRVTEVRNDKIYWIEDFSEKLGLLVNDFFQGLQLIARQDFYLPAKRFECHFAKYESGSFYKLHRDRHKHKPGRLLTCVLYLTHNQENDGGHLHLYDEASKKVIIHPEPGRVVVFDSSLEHEVTKSLKDRWSLTGWIRSDFHPGIRL